MFTCIATLWDWLDSPPLFTTTMESKKLQQLQQANSHIAPHQKKIPLSGGYQSIYQSNPMGDYHHASQSPVFQQYQTMSSNFAQMNLSGGSNSSGQLMPSSHHHHQQQSQYSTNQSTPSSGSQLTPIDTPPQSIGRHNISSKSGPYIQQNHHSPYGISGAAEQLYQSPRDARSYQINANNRPIDPITGAIIPSQGINNAAGVGNPVTALQQSYQQLQKAKLQAQIQTQNEALLIQQRTFAMRQALNPPIPHYHLQSQQNIAGMVASASMQSQQMQQQQSQQTAPNRNAPPSTLNLSSQFQPAQGPLKLNSIEQQHRQQQQQQQQHLDAQNNQTLLQQHQNAMLQKHYNHIVATQEKINEANHSYQQNIQSATDPSPVYIQQNHPGHVVNQACQTQISGAIGGNKNMQQSHVGQSPQTPTISSSTMGAASTNAKLNQQKTPQSSTEDSSNSPASTKSPTHSALDRKKGTGITQNIKSPITKRPASSPVTLSSWLYKQGSDGLKVWRKRWFVLSEYCLYYYKGPEEEKLLGSILLPSYKVSACLPEDKIYRKYAFKCEHTNMRTYWLAAENSEQMCQWVRALMAATLMQGSGESSDQNSQPSNSSLNNHSGENSDSGIHTFQSSQQSKLSLPHGPITPASDNGAGSNSGGMQPLYANAPPKPRRINDGGYSSPSPETSVERNESNPSQMRRKSAGMMSPPLHQMQQKSQHHAIYDTRTGNVKSALGIPNPAVANVSPGNQYASQQLQQRHEKRNSKHYDDYRNPSASSNSLQQLKQQQQPVPGTYNLGSMEIGNEQIRHSQSQRPSGDDIYGSGSEHNIYMQRALQQRLQGQLNNNSTGNMQYPNSERRTPDAYGRSKSAGRFFSDYEDIYNLMQQDKHLAQQQQQQQHSQGDLGYRRPVSPPSYNSQKYIPSMPSRYTPNHLEANSPHVNLRSRSSTGLNRPHSADFLEYEARAEAAAAIRPDAIRAQRPKSSLDINRTPDSYYYSEESYAEKMRQSALYLQKSPNHSANSGGTPLNYHNSRALPTSDISPYSTGMNTIGYENPYERTVKRNELLNEALMNQGASSVPRTNHRLHGGIATPTSILAKEYQIRQMQQNEQFLRSASARLPKKSEDSEGLNNAHPSLKDGERKREESMKRLLEWKQRMLQSPLTRKGVQQSGSPSILKLGSNPNILAPLNSSSNGIQRSRSETHANAGYNSYSSDDEASISIHNVRNIPKSNLHVKPDPSDPNYGYDPYYDPYATTPSDVRYFNERNNYYNQYEPNEYELQMQRDNYNNYPIRKAGSRAEIDLLERETSSQIRNLDVSAGDLLSRSHEELVLLLIQLRRQSSQIARAIEQCCTDIHEAQNRILSAEGLTRAESIQRLDYLKQHLLELEKQYEKSKPLVNLVDNMVKLGSLYRNNESSINRNSLSQHPISSSQLQTLSSSTSSILDRAQQQQQQQLHPESAQLDRVEFSNRLTDRRMLQEEQRFWDGLTPNQNELQSKVRQLYQLDQLLQEESGTLQSLQRDKEDLERALGGLRARIQDSTGPPLLLEAAKKQQLILERELSRVHQLLAENSKKLEQTVASNARLEQELLVLRQKLQASRERRGSQGNIKQASGIPSSESTQYVSSTTALLESELRRVQNLVVDMQRQRQDLSEAVRQLTDNSNRLYKEIGEKASSITASLNQSQKGRRNISCWTETDLDSMVSVDHISNNSSSPSENLTTPLYIDTSTNNPVQNHNNDNETYSLDNRRADNDDYTESNQFTNLTNQEKQEIKTVRIVKRESERRHRERGSTTTTMSSQNLDQVMEEEAPIIQNKSEENHSRSKSLPRSYNDHYEHHKHNNYSNGQIQHQPQNYGKKKNMQSKTLTTSKAIPGGAVRYSDYYTNNKNGTNIINNSNPYPVSMSDTNHNYTTAQQTYQNKSGGYRDKIISSSNSNRYNAHHRNSINGEDYMQQYPDDYKSLQNQCKTESLQSLNKSITDLSPVFQSEAARQIISEMSAGSASEDNGGSDKKIKNSSINNRNLSNTTQQHKHRRAIPREKRRHNTAPNNVNQKAMQKIQAENDMNRNNTNWRARDDLDMEVALRPRNNAPDVVRSALGQGEKISENTIDRLFGAPNKILIPERYIPEKAPELSPEEKKRRQEKVEAIKKMLSEAPINSSNDNAPQPPSKINEEKKQREHLLQLNQILAQQVMQMSKIVAGNPSQSNQNQ